MPRIRTIKPQFWEDPDVCKLSRDARLTAVALVSYADDRGRLEFSAAAIRGYAFRRDNVSDRRVRAWMCEVIDSGMACAYDADGFPYLWLPKFWIHQVINRPTESALPAHPEDPYGHIPIREALTKFRDDSGMDSLSNHGDLSASRAGGRLPSFPGPVVDVQTTNVNGNSNPGRRVDQSQWPDALSDELRPVAVQVLAVLSAVWGVRGGIEPQQRGVGLAMLRNPGADHLGVARKLEHWLLAGKGQTAHCGDIAARYGNWVADEPAGRRPTAANGHGRRPEVLERADAWKRHYPAQVTR